MVARPLGAARVRRRMAPGRKGDRDATTPFGAGAGETNHSQPPREAVDSAGTHPPKARQARTQKHGMGAARAWLGAANAGRG
eukprot:14909162-Alexandrium_andersonii.AAC.1